jgi:hypothetical protein
VPSPREGTTSSEESASNAAVPPGRRGRRRPWPEGAAARRVDAFKAQKTVASRGSDRSCSALAAACPPPLAPALTPSHPTPARATPPTCDSRRAGSYSRGQRRRLRALNDHAAHPARTRTRLNQPSIRRAVVGPNRRASAPPKAGWDLQRRSRASWANTGGHPQARAQSTRWARKQRVPKPATEQPRRALRRGALHAAAISQHPRPIPETAPRTGTHHMDLPSYRSAPDGPRPPFPAPARRPQGFSNQSPRQG